MDTRLHSLHSHLLFLKHLTDSVILTCCIRRSSLRPAVTMRCGTPYENRPYLRGCSSHRPRPQQRADHYRQLRVLGHANAGTGTSRAPIPPRLTGRSEEHTSELQSLTNLVCRLLLEKKNITWTC